MLKPNAMLSKVDEAYAARVRGDKEGLARHWAPNASYRIAADPDLLAGLPAGATDARQATEELIDGFEFKNMERLATLVDGNRVGIHWRVTLAAAAGGAPATTEMFDLIEFDEEGRIASLTQFIDSAKALSMLG